ncbi:MAG: hypothetical protein KAH18_05360 [Psychromonas sp.]|nr:hypothetical protein [Psychromonas sp.]
MNNKNLVAFTQCIKKSSLYQDFVAAISHPEVTHVSFDVFDTLVRRRCHLPEKIFTKVVECLPADISANFSLDATEYQQIRKAAERLARHDSHSEDIHFDDIFKQMILPQAHIDVLKQKEIEIEIEQSFADPFCHLLIKAVQKLDKQVIFISDMYLPHAIIKRLIDKSCKLTNYQLFVSSELGKTKYTGSLFVHVLSELGINASKLVHIGDDRLADVNSPKIMDINSFLFNTDKDFLDILLRENNYQVDLPAKVKLSRTLASLSMPKYEKDSQQFFYLMGARILGPILTQMSQWVVANCLRLKVDTLLSMMREGEIFKECINRHISCQSITALTTANFYVSRQSTYLPSMINADIKETLAKILNRMGYTIGDLMNEFEIKSSQLQAFSSLPVSSLSKLDVTGKNVLSILKKVFKDASVKVNTQIKENHQLFIKYLNQTLDFEDVDQSFATLDLGPGGTIAKQLSKASTLQAKVNFQLFSSQRSYDKSVDIAIKSFLPLLGKSHKSNAILARSPEVIEYLLVGKSGTTLGYQRDNGKVQPVCEKRELNEAQILQYEAFTEGVRAFQIVAQTLNLEPADEKERVSYTHLLSRLIDCPVSDEVKFMGQCQHEDNFGTQNKYNIIKADNIKYVKEKGINKFYMNFCRQPNETQRKMPWPQGVITHLEPSFLNTINRVNTHKDVHFSAAQELITVLIASDINDIIIYGAGDFYLYIKRFLAENKIKVSGIIDRRAQFSTFKINDITVSSIHNFDFSKTKTIVIASSAFVSEIKADLRQVIDLKKYNIINI